MKMTKMVRRCLIVGCVVLVTGVAPVLAEELISLGGGMVYDGCTEIIWLDVSEGPQSYAEAVAWVEALDVCGYMDWRLPTQQELLTLVSWVHGVTTNNPEPFVNLQPDWYWTSTSPKPGTHYLVHLQDQGVQEASDEYSGCVMAVRDAMPTPKEALLNLIDDVEQLDVPKGIKTSLMAKLEVAYHALDDANDDNDEAAVNALNDFIEFVGDKRGKSLSEGDADMLTQAASHVIVLIEGAP